MDAPDPDPEPVDAPEPPAVPTTENNGEASLDADIREESLTVEATQATTAAGPINTANTDAAAPSAVDDAGLATIHPRDRPDTIETLSNPEKEGRTIQMEVREEPIEPPKDWTPGGPERGM